jgi:hypothetical protein
MKLCRPPHIDLTSIKKTLIDLKSIKKTLIDLKSINKFPEVGFKFEIVGSVG